VATACHNCADGLADPIKPYHLKYEFNGTSTWFPVVNVCELVTDAIVIPKELPKRKPKPRVREIERPIKRTVEPPGGVMQKPINEEVFLMTVDRLTDGARRKTEVDEPSTAT
jgi:hypothetical protein